MFARVGALVARIVGTKQVVIATILHAACAGIPDTKLESAEQTILAQRTVARAIKTRRRTLGTSDSVQSDKEEGRHDKSG